MKVLFVGSKNMGFYALNILNDFHNQGMIKLVGVVARDDDDTENWYKSVSKRARELNLKLFMPSNLQDENFLKEVQELNSDIGFCCFYPKLFKEPFLNSPKLGFFNLHFAPLPRYRGAMPIAHAIKNGETEHGITIHKIEKGMDSGEIASQGLVPILVEDTGFELYRRCEKAGIILFQDTIQKFILSNGKLPLRKQFKEEIISYTRKDLTSLEVDFSWDRKRIYDFVRAFDFPPFPLPFVKINEKKFNLAIYPQRHGFEIENLNFIQYNDKRIYLIEDMRKLNKE